VFRVCFEAYVCGAAPSEVANQICSHSQAGRKSGLSVFSKGGFLKSKSDLTLFYPVFPCFSLFFLV
jgi:hypothetical protein